MAGPEGKKVLKFKLVEEKEGKGEPAPAGDKVSFKIPAAGGPKIKLKILGEEAPAALRGVEGTPEQLNKIMHTLAEMNKYQKRLADLEKQLDEEEDKRLVAEGELKALKPQLEEAKAELKKYREMEKEYLALQQRHEKLNMEKAELEAGYAKEDLKHLKEAIWAADGYLNRLERDRKEGVITEKEYIVKSKQLLKEKWDVQHRMLILEDILKKAVAKTELVAASKERHAKGLKLARKAEAEKPEKVEEKALAKEKEAERRERKAVPA
jgi:hypothetical protein